MDQDRVQVKLQIYADILKLNRGLKRFERLLEKKTKEFEELSKTYESYEKMDAEAKEQCVEKEKAHVLKQVKQLQEIVRCEKKIGEKKQKTCDQMKRL